MKDKIIAEMAKTIKELPEHKGYWLTYSPDDLAAGLYFAIAPLLRLMNGSQDAPELVQWKSKESAPKTGEWILVRKKLDKIPFTVRFTNPFSEDPSLADFRDIHGKVSIWDEWKTIV